LITIFPPAVDRAVYGLPAVEKNFLLGLDQLIRLH